MQLTLDDLDEIDDALVQWQKIWTGVRIQREEWVRKQMTNGDVGFAKHNQEVIETAKQHCEKTAKIINNLRRFQEEIYEWEEREPEEIDIMCHVTSVEEGKYETQSGPADP